MTFITRFNALRLLGRLEESFDCETGEVYYKPIDVFNKVEIRRLLSARALFEDSEFLTDRFYRKVAPQDTF